MSDEQETVDAGEFIEMVAEGVAGLMVRWAGIALMSGFALGVLAALVVR